jgi:hypothetical protein
MLTRDEQVDKNYCSVCGAHIKDKAAAEKCEIEDALKQRICYLNTLDNTSRKILGLPPEAGKDRRKRRYGIF